MGLVRLGEVVGGGVEPDESGEVRNEGTRPAGGGGWRRGRAGRIGERCWRAGQRASWFTAAEKTRGSRTAAGTISGAVSRWFRLHSSDEVSHR